MASKHHKPEEIAAKLRQVEVLVSQGETVSPTQRDRHLKHVINRGRAASKAASGYNWPPQVEADVSRLYKIVTYPDELHFCFRDVAPGPPTSEMRRKAAAAADQ